MGAAQRHVISFQIQRHKWSHFRNVKTLSSGGGIVRANKAAAGPIFYQYDGKTNLQLLVIQAEPRVDFLLLLAPLERDPLSNRSERLGKGSGA